MAVTSPRPIDRRRAALQVCPASDPLAIAGVASELTPTRIKPMLMSLCAALLLVALPAVVSGAEIVKSVHGFADLNFEVLEGPGSDSRFRMGEYDTYVTGTLDEHLAYLSEVTFEHEGAPGWQLDLERLFVRYEVRPCLSVSAGKFHSALGYWNGIYHHGSLLFASIDKPLTRSLFPIHTTGLLVSGREISSARIGYNLMIGNGIGGTPKTDNDDGKSLNLQVSTKAIEGVELAMAVYYEGVSQGAARGEVSLQDGPAAEDVSLLLLSPSIAASAGRSAVEAELVLARSEGDQSGDSSQARALYAMLTHDLGRWTPFVKLDVSKVDGDDPFYRVEDRKLYSVGVDYHFSHLAVAKVQVRHNAPGTGDAKNDLLTQIAIGF